MSRMKLQLIGYLGGDCKVKDVDGTNAISFSIASTEKWTSRKGVTTERTTWVDCTLWRKPEHSAVSEWLKKGTQVMVEGRPGVSAYISSQNGEAVGLLFMRVDELILLGRPGASAAPSNTAAELNNNQSNNYSAGSQEEDLPF